MSIPRKVHAVLRRIVIAALIALTASAVPLAGARADRPAKEIFGAAELPAVLPARAIGFYSKGCLAGGVAIATDGPAWQAMRLSRNRRWGHPDLVALVERLSRDAAARDGWPGLLIGDLAQPRGGPMLSGHASHQVGLDADIWLTPMPDRTLSASEREDISATSMLKKDTLYVDDRIWTPAHARVLMRAASYPEVDRIFIHPGIKKKLCDTWTGDRSAMGKLRPYYGHHYHFHIRIKCPPGASGCKSQAPPPQGTGCDDSLAWWFTAEPWAPAKPEKTDKPKPQKRDMRLSDLPAACAQVVQAPGPASEADVTFGSGSIASPDGAKALTLGNAASAFAPVGLPARIPIPVPRPVN
ncbi:MAG: penicillin-insensitive murein endopeptidase [Hoeflea sp.]|uniref:penicillin-insensitive murein endopeptidase n=1 Tax=Hoeflea sp. TaxID=1940281 RepID=UPI001D73ECC4|nr:penicillin-insensitive murein endopeptidase [Hoeflea sp.]MBU4531552.1 penicillin-insensitive murein endopeptidase [Alphaproteobacteria bacterium]MBU4544409.1 penicillin-insensitive murein endopeptidase [Alphaproteobacteria bacterium]MBU4550354.1 penicillin-insensitive murein endopeptidase [Alphaproteobacteria bacterium]MBV1724828.1 penicillin-insensitive murein endopeptidase [Hoeflea sp.]MBV1760848.1 penicillin-insensitive murein endopeptidase [Hoeflea sp.]